MVGRSCVSVPIYCSSEILQDTGYELFIGNFARYWCCIYHHTLRHFCIALSAIYSHTHAIATLIFVSKKHMIIYLGLVWLTKQIMGSANS